MIPKVLETPLFMDVEEEFGNDAAFDPPSCREYLRVFFPDAPDAKVVTLGIMMDQFSTSYPSQDLDKYDVPSQLAEANLAWARLEQAFWCEFWKLLHPEVPTPF